MPNQNRNKKKNRGGKGKHKHTLHQGGRVRGVRKKDGGEVEEGKKHFRRRKCPEVLAPVNAFFSLNGAHI